MKKIAIIGIVALVVIGCVLAAGCTSTSTTSTTPASSASTTTTDAVVGTWTLPNGTTVVFGEDFKGIMTTGDNKTNFTWKKTTDGKYQVNNEKGDQVIWTMDSAKNSMTNTSGMVLTKKVSSESTTTDDQIIGIWVKEDESSAFIIDANNEGTYYTIKDDAIDEETPIIWKKNSNGTYALISGMGTATVTLDTVKGQFTADSGSVFIKQASDTSGGWYPAHIKTRILPEKDSRFTSDSANF